MNLCGLLNKWFFPFTTRDILCPIQNIFLMGYLTKECINLADTWKLGQSWSWVVTQTWARRVPKGKHNFSCSSRHYPIEETLITLHERDYGGFSCVWIKVENWKVGSRTLCCVNWTHVQVVPHPDSGLFGAREQKKRWKNEMTYIKLDL